MVGPEFQSLVLGIMSKLMETYMQKRTIRFWSSMQDHLKNVRLETISFFSAWHWSQTHCKCCKAHLDRTKHTMQHYQSLDLNITAAVWDHLDRGCIKSHSMHSIVSSCIMGNVSCLELDPWRWHKNLDMSPTSDSVSFSLLNQMNFIM